MLLRHSPSRRRATTLVEKAISLSLMFFLTLGTIVVAMGVFAYQQVASLAREGARYASVRGAQYSSDTGNAMATSTSIKSAITSMASGLDTSQLSVSASWDNSSEVVTYNDSSGNPTTNYVTVTVSYTWHPPLYLSTMTLSSTSVMPMQY
jgi:hypothetical protein